MNISFWAAMILLLLVAIIILIFPLLKIRQSRSLAHKTSNIQLHEEKLNELNIDLEEDRIDQSAYKLARQELDRDLLEDTPIENKESAALHYKAEAKKRPALALVIAVLLPTLSLLVYLQLGMHADSMQEAEVENNSAPSVAEMVVQLELHLKENKGELKDWVMLGRAYKYLGRYGEAANAFATASDIEPRVDVLLEHAEAIALMNDETFNAESRDLILRALALEPDNMNALWFAGVAELQFRNYRQAIEYLSQLSSEAAQDPEVDKSIRFYIGKARDQLIAAGEEVASIDELLPLAKKTLVAGQTSLQVTIDVSEEARQNFASTDVVFVYAKALKGPKMPLAAQRLTLADLPATVVLDDSMAMVEGMSLSSFKQVIVSARVTKTGTAIAQSGDYIGQVIVEDVASAKNLNVGIDSLVP